ncbi:hypothetical protein KY311_01155 [Candidatus Woesearchaeota archaeon]|nr:hypothetical protein [Candidatus Woesearchaeota archaeon]
MYGRAYMRLSEAVESGEIPRKNYGSLKEVYDAFIEARKPKPEPVKRNFEEIARKDQEIIDRLKAIDREEDE